MKDFNIYILLNQKDEKKKKKCEKKINFIYFNYLFRKIVNRLLLVNTNVNNIKKKKSRISQINKDLVQLIFINIEIWLNFKDFVWSSYI